MAGTPHGSGAGDGVVFGGRSTWRSLCPTHGEEPWKAFRQQHTMIRCALFQEDSAAEWRSGWKKPSSK